MLAGGYDQVHLWRQVLKQKCEGIVDRSCIDYVIVVQDEDKVVLDGSEFVEQTGQDRLGRRRLGGSECPEYAFPDVRRDRPQCGNEVGYEARGVAVPPVQRQPGSRSR